MKLKVQKLYISIALCMMLILLTSMPINIFAEEFEDNITTYHAQNNSNPLTEIIQITEVTTPPALSIIPFATEIHSGTVGTAPWRLYDDGTLIVEGGLGRQIQGGSSPWLSYDGLIQRIIFEDELIANANLSNLFNGLRNVVTIEGLNNIDTSNVTTMRLMFQNTDNLTEIIGICEWDTSNVTTMARMFENATSLTTLDLSNWKTGSVRDFGIMFSNAYSLVSVGDLSDWDTSNATTMAYMFTNTRSLQSLNVTNWDTSNVTNMRLMFSNTDNLTEIIGICGWNTSSVITMARMFENATSLTTLDLSNWKTGSVRDFGIMFSNAYSLVSVGDLSGWDTSNATTMAYMFTNVHSLQSLNVTNWDTSNVTNMRLMFQNTISLTEIIGIGEWNPSSVITMARMFENATSLTVLDLSNWKTGNVRDFGIMFSNAHRLVSVGDLSDWDTSNATTMAYMFTNAHSLQSLNVTNWDTSNVTNMRLMFQNTTSLTEIIGIGEWNPSSVITMARMFENATSLTVLDLSNWKTSSVRDVGIMFSNAHSLQSLNMANWDTSNVITMQNMFRSTSSLRELTLGENFAFHANAGLPAVPNNSTYAGMWRNVGIGTNQPWDYTLTSAELMANFNGTTMADTWVWATHTREYHINYIYVDFAEDSTQDFLAGNLCWTDLSHILGNTPSLLNRTYETGTFAQVLRELPIPALSGWELLYSYIIFENPAMGVTGHISQLPVGFDVNNVSGNIIIIVLFI